MLRTPPVDRVQTRSMAVVCAICDQRGIRDDGMVNCDVCNSWYHFACIDVDPEVLNTSYQCTACVDEVIRVQQQAPQGVDAVDEAIRNRLQVTNGVVPGIEHDQQLVNPLVDPLQLEPQPVLEQNVNRLDHESAMELRELEVELNLIKREKELLARKRELISSGGQPGSSRQSRAYSNPQAANVGAYGSENQFRSPILQSTMHQPHGRANLTLTQQHLTARQTMPRDLPKFNGNAAEWPVFISCYEQTTALMGLSNNENLVRLQNCLGGSARTLVQAQLSLPACVPQIIDTLRMVFGRPEYIVDDQINTIRRTPAPKSDRLETVVVYAIAVKNMCATLEQSGMVDHLKNPTLLRELIEKLPSTMKLDWVNYSRNMGNATIKDFAEWLHRVSLDICTVTRININAEEKNERSRSKNFIGVHADNGDKKQKCGICDEQPHPSLGDCKKFHQMPIKQRWESVNKLHICRVCLKKHRPYCEASQFKCNIDGCTYGHHLLLHYKKYEPEMTAPNPILTHSVPSQKALYQIIPICIRGPNQTVVTFALLDNASSVTMVEEWILEKIGVHGKIDPLHLQWTGNTRRTEETSQRVKLQIEGNQGGIGTQVVKARSVKSIGLPPQTLDAEDLKQHCRHLQKIPIQSFHNVQPAMIIGLDNWRVAAPLEIVEGELNQPIATRCRLGWAIQGQWRDGGQTTDDYPCHVHVCVCNENENKELHALIQRFYEVDHLPSQIDTKPFSMDDKRDMEVLKNNVKFINDRYQTRLLWKYENFELPDSWPMAMKRWKCLERELLKNPSLYKLMNEQIEKFVRKGYARELTDEELAQPVTRKFTLPVFPVVNPNKPNKVRVVFDAAAKVNGMSLNSFLSKGPDITASLYSILLNFRMHIIGISGDVEEMFQQILVDPIDQHVQRFIWKGKVYVLLVLTFGATCSPSIAQFVKNINADRFVDTHNRAVDAIKNHTYADDTLDGARTPQEALQLAQDIKYVYQQGGFNIRNWRSNSLYVQKTLEPGNHAKTVNMDTSNTLEKVLGMFWDTEEDIFVFSLKYNKADPAVLSGKKRATKRELLRVLMSIFDPLGLLANITIELKIIVQGLWKTGSDWDSEVNDEHQELFETWLEHLREVTKLKIPRCYIDQNVDWENISCQLHVFTDASEDAYAAVTYLRITMNDQVSCVLIGAKTRVAPIKIQSVPRMELNGARLGAQLGKTITDSLRVPLEKIVYWTDAKTVLLWLRGNARANPAYVAYRIADIQSLTDIANWRYVPTHLNVADEATKIKEKYTIHANSRWYKGPEYLYLPEEEWPQDSTLKHEIVVTHVVWQMEWLVEPLKFSNWERMLRVVAWCIRYRNKTKQKIGIRATRSKSVDQNIPEPLTSSELAEAENTVIKTLQWEAFPEEMTALSNDTTVPEKSEILYMAPYMDSAGVMRSKTRLENCDAITDETKRPIILPSSHHVTGLIIRSFHERLNHVLHATTLNRIRGRYWIPKLRSTYNKLRSNCSVCIINNAKPTEPQMAVLPEGRVTIARPFTHVGVDYFGPLKVAVGRRVEKRYGALFTCLSTRAVHIELAHTLSTDSFILVFRSFINRRGAPRRIYSDCGTNFVGAEKVLKNELRIVNFGEVAEKFISPDLEWKFNPPSAPHMGGVWERQIRSIKRCLYAIIPETRLVNDEVLKSLMTEVEFTMNSRPLIHVPLDGIEEPITPNHFLLGDASGVKPIGPAINDGGVLLNSWRRSQQLANRFWKIWVNEYLPTIAQRTKWYRKTEPLAVGDIVIVVNEGTPRNTWQKGRIIGVNPGNDGQVRSAAVQTNTGIYTLPAVKIAVLKLGKITGEPRLGDETLAARGAV